MAVANVLRISIKGALPGGEDWSVNPVYQIGGVSTAEDITSDQATAIAVACAAVVAPAGVLGALSTSTNINGIRVEARRWDGTLAALGEAVKGSPQAGTGGQAHPYQTSAVLSLRTAGLGASGRGRVYWPATGITLGATNLRPNAGAVTPVLSGLKSYLGLLAAAANTITTNDVVLSVWSRKNNSTQPVVNLQMGDIMDTQRRRRDAAIETYQTVAWP